MKCTDLFDWIIIQLFTYARFLSFIDLSSETNRLDTGLVIELWNKGMLWDKIIGTYWLPLLSIPHSNIEGPGKWVFLDAQVSHDHNGEVVGTHIPTGHSLNIDARFELPNGMV